MVFILELRLLYFFVFIIKKIYNYNEVMLWQSL
nr:MAG TPA: hypothetical protein [Caudoviricetes sp.]